MSINVQPMTYSQAAASSKPSNVSTPARVSSPTKRPAQDSDSTQVQASKLVKMFDQFKSQIENTDRKIEELAQEEEFLRREFALQLSRIEARRAEVLREQDRENRIREAMHRAEDFIDIVRNDLAFPTTQNVPSQDSTSSQNLPKDTEGSQAVQSESTPSVTEVVQDSSSTTPTTAPVVQPATLSLAVLDDSFYTPASSPTRLNSAQSAESSAAIMPPPATTKKAKAKKPRVPREPRIEPKEEVEDYCVPAWFLESVAALETPQEEAMEVDTPVTAPSQDPVVEPDNNQQ